MKTNKLALISSLVNQSAAEATRDADAKIAKRKTVAAPRERAGDKKRASPKSGNDAKNVTGVTNGSNALDVKDAGTAVKRTGRGPAGLIRFQGYFREAEMAAIRSAQSAFIERGFRAPPENQIVRIALQTLNVDDRAVEVLVQLLEEKKKR